MPRPAPFAFCLYALTFAACGDQLAQPRPQLAELPRALSVAEEGLAASCTAFGTALLREVYARAEGPNVVVSPLSVSLALGMALNGARGETFDDMRETLALPESTLEDLNAGYSGLAGLLAGLDEGVQLAVANALFPEQSLKARPEYLLRVRAAFDAEVRALDFRNPSAVNVINGWVHAKTRGRIPTIVERITSEEVLFLVNAVHFKAPWRDAFDPERTRPAPFRLEDGSTVEVPTMNRRPAALRHLAAEEVEGIELPYGRGAFTMVVLLPREGASLDDLVARLDGETWAEWMQAFTTTTVAVALPRFRVEFGAGLVEPLSSLGMEIAFDAGRADFGDLGHTSPGAELYLSRVEHRVFLEVDEEGTEAAAATAVGVGRAAEPLTFRANRPFLVAIHERFSGALLFIGAIGDPTAN